VITKLNQRPNAITTEHRYVFTTLFTFECPPWSKVFKSLRSLALWWRVGKFRKSNQVDSSFRVIISSHFKIFESTKIYLWHLPTSILVRWLFKSSSRVCTSRNFLYWARTKLITLRELTKTKISKNDVDRRLHLSKEPIDLRTNQV